MFVTVEAMFGRKFCLAYKPKIACSNISNWITFKGNNESKETGEQNQRNLHFCI